MPARTHDPALTKAHLSNRFALSLVAYFSEVHGEAVARAIVEEAGLTLEYLRDSERWISVEFDRRFCDAAAHHLHGLETSPGYDHPLWQDWRDAAASMFKRQGMGPLWLLLWAMDGPREFFRDIEHMYARGNRVTRMRLAGQGPGWASVIAEMSGDEVVQRPGACWSRRGFFEAVPTIWNLPDARVEHAECIHQDPRIAHCRYHIRFNDRVTRDPHADLRRLRSYVRAIVPDLLAQLDARYLEHRDVLLTQRKVAAYVPEHVLEAMRINPEEEVILGGTATEGAVLFADIKGFTRRCQEVGAGEVVRQLNLYFEVMDEVILAHGGIIDKRIGDGIMAVFIDRGDGVARGALGPAAVACGLAMLRALPRCNALLAEIGGEPLTVRVGVAAGPLVHGNIGSRARLEHTVIGETVNLAARLEAAATPGRLLTLPALAEGLGAPRRWARTIAAKGLGELAAVELAPADDE